MPLVLVALAGTGNARTTEVDWGPWYAVGPFGKLETSADLDAVFWPEEELASLQVDGDGPDLAASGPGVQDVPVAWSPLRALPGMSLTGQLDVGHIDLRRQLPPPKSVLGWSADAAAYLYRRVEAREAIEVPLFFAAEEAARIWVNGRAELDTRASWGFHATDCALRLRLDAGVNHLLVKVASGERGGFSVQLSAYEAPDDRAVGQAVAAGVRHLLRHQLPDGTWEGWSAEQPERTACVVEALLASGLGPDDPSVVLGLNAVRALGLASTAGRAHVVRALAPLEGHAHADLLDEAYSGLIDSQESSGFWDQGDMLDTALALDALRIARDAGGEPPVKTTRLIAKCVAKVKRRLIDEEEGSAGMARPRKRVADAWWTSATLVVLDGIEDLLGDSLSRRQLRDLDEMRTACLAWIEARARWNRVVGAEDPHGDQLLHVVQLQRALAACGDGRLRGLDLATALRAHLVEKQGRSGEWSYYYSALEIPDTAAALLILSELAEPGREPAPALWGKPGKGSVRGWALAASAGSPTTVWVDRVATDARPWPKQGRVEILGRHVASEHARVLTEISLDGAAGALGPLPVAVELERRGPWELSARLASSGGPAPALELGSVWVLAAAAPAPGSAVERADLSRAKPTLGASSFAEESEPEAALDGNFATAWVCVPEDDSPRIQIDFKKAVHARALTLSHATAGARDWDEPQARRVRVIVNGREEHELEMPQDPWNPGRIELGVRVSSLEIVILESRNRLTSRDGVGFSEIELVAAE